MKFVEVKENKKEYLPLLLLADEQEDMVDRYLDRGRMYVLDDGGVKCECVVTDEGGGVLEIKNIATVPECQGNGYGKAMIDFIAERYRGQYEVLQVGTGDSPLTIPFYEKCGFARLPHGAQFFHGSLRPSHIRGRGFAGGYGVSAEAALNFRQDP